MVKIKSREMLQSLSKGTTITGLASLDARLSKFGVISVEKAFRHQPIPLNSNIPDISHILKVRIPERLSTVMVARELERDSNLEYAEPVYVRRLLEVPNDPRYSEQHYLPQIHAPEAWDVQKGDSTIVIAIVDNGTDYTHNDLAINVWTNKLEASGVPGVDDDGNGFVDDIHGWDFGDDDADPINAPSGRAYGHGTHCAGIACAVTNNAIGVAGVSWNCRFMPVKVCEDRDPWSTTNSYEGIIYAVDNGADIISNSWGGHIYSRWEQEVINYAYSKGVIVVCAAGNDYGEFPMYPASYQYAISVASVRKDDVKPYYSSYGPWVDLSAPGGAAGAGYGILSTVPGNEYDYSRGTSKACPVVAAVCGLVKSRHPDWDYDQIVRQVILTADNIDAKNSGLEKKLGYGRVNAHRALTVTNLPVSDARLAVLSHQFSDSLYGNNDGVFERNETIQLHCDIKNWSIDDAATTTISLISKTADVQILNGAIQTIPFPADTTLPLDFTMKIAENASSQITELFLRMQTGRGYSREEKVTISVGKMPILFVDHDMATTNLVFHVELFFRNMLDQNNLEYGYWDTETMGFPKTETLLKFPITILSCSNYGGWFNFENVQKIIESYLDGGGHLFICGDDVGHYLFEVWGNEESKNFMRDYLHADYLANDSDNQQVNGVELDPISHDLSFHIWYPGFTADWQAPDVIAPTADASTIFTYSDGRGAGIKYAGAHKVVYLAFGLESVDSYQNTQIGFHSPIRTELLMRILNWLNFIEHDPLQNTDNVDSSRTVIAHITGNVTDLQEITLCWRVQGDSTFTSIAMTETDSGDYRAVIPGPGQAAAIEYFIQASHSYYTWSSPVGAPNTVYRYNAGEMTNVPAATVLSVSYQLIQNYPNPFNPVTTISYQLPASSRLDVSIYNLLGQKVATLVSKQQPAGYYNVVWDASGFSAGLYFCRMKAENTSIGSPIQSEQRVVKVIKLALVK